jgi:hypothetical protein
MGPGVRRDDEGMRSCSIILQPLTHSISPSHPFFPISAIACIAAM